MLHYISKLDWNAIIVVLCLLPYIMYVNGFKDDPKFLRFCLRMNRRIYDFLVYDVQCYMRKRAVKLRERIDELEKK